MIDKSINEYLEREMIVPQKYKEHILISGTFTLLGTLIGVRLGSYWFYIAMFMLIVFISGIISVSKFLSRELTLKRKLIIQTIIYISWFIQISLFETIIFTYEYGWHIGIVLLYLPGVVTPIILSSITAIMLKKERVSRKIISSSQIAIIGVSTSIVGWRTGIVLKNLSAEHNIIVILICFTFVASVFSIGFLNIQKLYYLHKYKKSDLK